jgi:6-phosphogluconate dehydrogenase
VDISKVLRCWRHGSVIRSWLIELVEEAYRADGEMEKIPSYVADTGEVNWRVDDALHVEVPVPVISQAVTQHDYSPRPVLHLVARGEGLHHGFGGHLTVPSDAVFRERWEGRIGRFVHQ